MNQNFIQIISFCFGCLFCFSACAEESKIHQADPTGNIQYHKPSAVIEDDGRVIETDQYGNKQYHKPQYQMQGDRIYQTDKFGNIQYHKPHGVQKK